jgi:hypothetical protein
VKTTVIQLEPFDDVNSTRDKIARCGTGRILLVLPAAYKVLDRRIDLVRLSRSSQEQGAQLAIVSDDPDVQAHARETGIPIFTSAAVAQKIPWRRTRFKKRFLERSENKPDLADLQVNASETRRSIFFAGNRKLQVVAFVIGIISLAALAWFFIPSATVTLPVMKRDQDLDIQVSTSPSYLTVNPVGTIPSAIMTTIIERSAQTASSGTVVIPDKASAGQAQFTNLNPMAVIIPQGTILIAYSAQLVRFEVTAAVTVPAGSGKVALGSIQAVKAGSGGNVAAKEIRAIEGSLGLQLTVTNLDPTQGGTDRTVSSPTQADYSKLREDLLKDMNGAAFQDLQSRLQAGDTIISSTLKLTSILSEKRDAQAGTPSDTARLTIRAEFIAWHFRNTDLNQLAAIVLDAKLESGNAGLPATLQETNLTEPVVQNGAVRWQVHLHRQIIRVWDKQEITNAVLGQTRDAAAQILVNHFKLDQPPRIQLIPDWWPFMPGMSFRIEVKVE